MDGQKYSLKGVRQWTSKKFCVFCFNIISIREIKFTRDLRTFISLYPKSSKRMNFQMSSLILGYYPDQAIYTEELYLVLN